MSNNNLKFGDEGSLNQEIINQQFFETIKKQGKTIEELKSEVSEATKQTRKIAEITYGKVDSYGVVQQEGLIHKIAKSQEQQESFKNYKIDFITVGGIFVSIFTFISIEIQILRYVCDFWRIVGFSLIIFGVLSSFAFLIQYIGKNWTQEKYNFPKGQFLLFCIAPFILGLFSPLGNIIYEDSCVVYEKNLKSIEYRIDNLERGKDTNEAENQ